MVREGFLEDSWGCLEDEEALAKGQEEKGSPGGGNLQRDARGALRTPARVKAPSVGGDVPSPPPPAWIL